MVQQTRAYRDRSREYLAKAFRELEDGDLTQVSEKGWGAAAQMVKAVADERGMDHHCHAAVFRAAQVLAREIDDNDTEIQFALASDLHRNFYEETLDRKGVELRLQQVTQFVDRVERLLRPR
jgi:hypothetical protein